MVNINIEQLLKPISEDKPCGEWLRYEGTYDKIQEARREDEAYLDQGVWQSPLKKADWASVRKFCSDSLTNRTKDLQLSVWLLEAWSQQAGYVGLKAGVTLNRRLCEMFWDDLYPSIEDSDVEYRVAPLNWLNEKYSAKIRFIPITQPKSRDTPTYCYADWETVLNQENNQKRGVEPGTEDAEKKMTREKFRLSMLDTPISFYIELDKILSTVTTELRTFEKYLDIKCGKLSPSFNQIHDQLGRPKKFVSDVLKERESELPKEEILAFEEEKQEEPKGKQRDAKSQQTYGPIRNRADAYRLLNDAADYLLKTEPHSPVPYLVKRAVAWGALPLPDLLNQLVFDPNDRMQILTLLGLIQQEQIEGIMMPKTENPW